MLAKLWYSKNPVLYLLLPLSYVYLFFFKLHKLIYKLGIKKTYQAAVPIIVVGNLTVGGTGKTPMVIELTKLLLKEGYRPGIISRGYKGKTQNFPRIVTPNCDPIEVGDEPSLIARKTLSPVSIFPQRKKSIELLVKHFNCNVIISDDGLQHHAIVKDIEIIVVDGERRFGNGFCLPAGPLREPLAKLAHSDFVVFNETSLVSKYSMFLQPHEIYNLCDPTKKLTTTTKKIHAVAAIGHPQRFFTSLQQAGFTFTPYEFPDHHCFVKEDFQFCNDDDIVIMTEKDAIKCQAFAKDNFWVLPVEACLSRSFTQDLVARVALLS